MYSVWMARSLNQPLCLWAYQKDHQCWCHDPVNLPLCLWNYQKDPLCWWHDVTESALLSLILSRAPVLVARPL